MLTGIKGALTLPVKDLPTSVAWYRKVFAVDPVYKGVDRDSLGVTTPITCFRLGGVTVWLAPPPAAGARGREDADRGGTLVFMTDRDLAELRVELAARGVHFADDEDEDEPGAPLDHHGVRQGGDTELIWLYDPDWYRIEFCRVKNR